MVPTDKRGDGRGVGQTDRALQNFTYQMVSVIIVSYDAIPHRAFRRTTMDKIQDPTLVYEGTTNPVKCGDVVHIRNEPYVVTGWAVPHKPASTGRVYVKSMDERNIHTEYFPSVIKADWIGRKDR